MKKIALFLLLALTLNVAANAQTYEDIVTAYERKDYPAAFAGFSELASKGDARAQFRLGVMYEIGVGVPEDSVKAAKWYRLAADQGNAGAQNNLGNMYLEGQGVPRDHSEAIKLYQLAANQGNAGSQSSLGFMYDSGQGVPQDYAESAKWYRLAANQGNRTAQFNLGLKYEKGQGVPQDSVEAHKWYNLAAAGGKTDAGKSRALIEAKMTGEQIAEAQKRAAIWKPANQTGPVTTKASPVGASLATKVATPPTSAPRVAWKLASSFPKALDIAYDGAESLAKSVLASTKGQFSITSYAAGEVVPSSQVLDATSQGTIQLGQSYSGYFFDKDPALLFDSNPPYGLTDEMYESWLKSGGLDDIRHFFAKRNVLNMPCGAFPEPLGGWFKSAVTTVAGLQGLKFRVSGQLAKGLDEFGVLGVRIAGGDIYPALERGSIDAAQWFTPYDDERLGFYKVADFALLSPFEYGSRPITLYVNLKEWNSLPAEFQRALSQACASVAGEMKDKYRKANAAALKRMQARGTQVITFPAAERRILFDAATRYYERQATTSEDFRRLYARWKQFRKCVDC